MTSIADNTPAVDTNSVAPAIVAVPHDPNIEKVETKFNFRTVKVKDDITGQEVESKRAPLTLVLPLVSVEGAIAAFNASEKQRDLIIEAMRRMQLEAARSIINDDEKAELTEENFPYQLISWEAIANMPKASRRGSGIAKEVWEAFGQDYAAVMPAATGKDAGKIANAVKLLLGKFNSIKSNKPVIEMLKGQLAIYINASPNAEAFMDCYEALTAKATELLLADDAALMDNL
jgi:hypothetical protein